MSSALPVVEGFAVRRLLGAGAAGMVYLAEQHEPRRVVALKVLRAAGLEPAALDHLEREAAVLAALDHSGIVPLLSQGRCAAGAPWFAMELVDGEPLDAYAGRHGLALGERLDLFRQLVAAVAHAHQRGIIHRDLKPANVLVSATARGGRVRVLDFGLARTAESGADRDAAGQMLGTLAYMSPEQAAGRAHAVAQQSDVYALGVILYELVTGRRPVDVAGCWVGEAARRIAESTPPRPRSLARIPADLEAVILKCLEKEPRRRYQSAASLLEDVDRLRAGEPVRAHPPSTIYQLRCAGRRHPTGVALAALALVLLGVSGPLVFVMERRQREAVAAERDVARAVLDVEKEILRSPEPSLFGIDVRLRDVLERAARDLDRGAPRSAPVEAALRKLIGRGYVAVGDAGAAALQFERANQLLEHEELP